MEYMIADKSPMGRETDRGREGNREIKKTKELERKMEETWRRIKYSIINERLWKRDSARKQ